MQSRVKCALRKCAYACVRRGTVCTVFTTPRSSQWMNEKERNCNTTFSIGTSKDQIHSFLESPSWYRDINLWYVNRLRPDNSRCTGFFASSHGPNVKKCFVARLPKNLLLHGTVAQWTQQTSHRSRSVWWVRDCSQRNGFMPLTGWSMASLRFCPFPRTRLF